MSLILETERNFFIQILNNIKASDKDNIKAIENYLEKNNFTLEELNDSNFDVLIYTLESRASNEVKKYIINRSQYKTYNYKFQINKKYADYDKKFKRSELKFVKYLVPLFCAIKNEDFELADLLMKKKKADINYVAKKGENVVIYMYNNNFEIKKSIFKFVFNKGFYVRGFPIKLIDNLIVDSQNNNDISSIFKKYIFDDMFITRILNIYKQKTPLSNEQIDNLIREEKSKIKINDKTYTSALQEKNIKGLTLLLKYDSDTFDIIMDRIRRFNLMNVAKYDYIHDFELMNHLIQFELLSFQLPILEKLFKESQNNEIMTSILFSDINKLFRSNFSFTSLQCENILLAASKSKFLSLMNLVLYSILTESKDVKMLDKLDIKHSIERQNEMKRLIELAPTSELKEKYENYLKESMEAYNPFSVKLIKEGDSSLFLVILNIAVKLKSYKVIKFLVENKELKGKLNLNKEDKNGENPIKVALSMTTNDKKSLNIFKYLVEQGTNDMINENQNFKSYLLPLALIRKRYMSLKYLLNQKNLIIKDIIEDTNDSMIKAIYKHDFNKVKSLLNTEKYKNKINMLKEKYKVEVKNDDDNNKCNNITIEDMINFELTKSVNNEESESEFDENDDELDIKYKFTPLTLSYLLNDKEIFNLLIDNHWPVNEMDDYGYSILHFMILREDTEMVKYLIDETELNVNFQVNPEDKELSHSALEISLNNCGKKMIQTLLQSPTLNVNQYNNRKETLLITILKSRSFTPEDKKELIQIVLDKGSDVNKVDGEGKSPIALAIGTSSLPLVKLLIKYKANVNYLDIRNKCPLRYAIEMRNEDMVSLLIKAGADVNFVNAFEASVLAYAVKENYFPAVKLLVDHGAKVNFVLKYFDELKGIYSLFFHAIYMGNVPIIKYLLDHGVDYDFTDEESLSSLSSMLFIKCDTEVIKYFIENKLDMSNLRASFFFELIWRDLPEMLRIFVEHGLDIELKDNNGKSLLENAVNSRSSKIVNYLIGQGADVQRLNQNIKSVVSLIVMHEPKDMELLKILVDHGLDVNSPDNNGYTLILYAIKMRQLDFIEYLLQSGANPLYINEKQPDRPSVERINEQCNFELYYKRYKQIQDLLNKYKIKL